MYSFKISLEKVAKENIFLDNNCAFWIRVELLQPAEQFKLAEVMGNLKMLLATHMDQMFDYRGPSIVLTADALFSNEIGVKSYLEQLANNNLIDSSDVISFVDNMNVFKQQCNEDSKEAKKALDHIQFFSKLITQSQCASGPSAIDAKNQDQQRPQRSHQP